MPVNNRIDNRVSHRGLLNPTPYMARIVGFVDPNFQGGVEVSLLHEVGNQIADDTQTFVVQYASPFYGATAYEAMGKNNTHDDSQQSYGFWGMPPDVGVTGIVIFVNGDPSYGFWIACVQDKFVNHMIPAIGATKNYETDSDYDQADHPLPVAEHNRKAHDQTKSLEIDKVLRGVHPIANRFKEQGLIRDEFRGPTTSTVRRDLPNMVFGISSPGPLDRTGKQSYIGSRQDHVLAPISRQGGTQFVMDDGDDRYFRETSATDGPPVYIKGGGDVNLPYNEYFRIRTRTGHQVLLHNTEDLIYIGNAKGTAWVELTSDGKIDIFSNDSISIRTKQDFNFYADRDFNIEAGRNFNVKVAKEMHTHVGQDSISIVGKNRHTRVVGDDILVVDNNQNIHIKGSVAVTHEKTLHHRVVGSVDVVFDNTYTHTVTDNVNLKFGANFFQTVGNNADYLTSGGLKDTVSGKIEVNAGGQILTTSGGSNETSAGGSIIKSAPFINMNGMQAATAASATSATNAAQIDPLVPPQALKIHTLPDIIARSAKDTPVDLKTILRRVPSPESYPHHENLNPALFKPDKTDRDSAGRYASDAGDSVDLRTPPIDWKKYKKPTDNPF